MISLPIINFAQPTSWNFSRAEKMVINQASLTEWLREKTDVKYLHLTSSACLSGMADPRIPEQSRGYLLPAGELELYGITPSSGEGGVTDTQLKYHSISVCSTVDIEDAMSTLQVYSMTEGFISAEDYPVIFAITTQGDTTNNVNNYNYQVINSPFKMDDCEFSIRDYIPYHEISAILVPEDKEFDARNRLLSIPNMQSKIDILI